MSQGPAAAASTVTCKKFTGSIPLDTGSLAHCTDKANTGKSGTLSIGGNLVSGVWRIDWATGTGSSFLKVTVTPVGGPGEPADEPERYNCPKGTTEDEIAGTVTDFTGTASSIPIGDTVDAEVCITSSGTYKLESHAPFLL
ncbi:MAG: hypothetical protein JO368_05355 [Acidimicrobiales bacterium]|nr:hypothetical protein [Acidimicrobiales bacterium]